MVTKIWRKRDNRRARNGVNSERYDEAAGFAGELWTPGERTGGINLDGGVAASGKGKRGGPAWLSQDPTAVDRTVEFEGIRLIYRLMLALGSGDQEAWFTMPNPS